MYTVSSRKELLVKEMVSLARSMKCSITYTVGRNSEGRYEYTLNRDERLTRGDMSDLKSRGLTLLAQKKDVPTPSSPMSA